MAGLPGKASAKWLIGLLLAAWILVPASIGMMHSFGAWWGALIVPGVLALVLAFWWAADNVGR